MAQSVAATERIVRYIPAKSGSRWRALRRQDSEVSSMIVTEEEGRFADKI